MRNLTFLLLLLFTICAIGCNDDSVTNNTGYARVRLANNEQIVPIKFDTSTSDIYRVNDTIVVARTDDDSWGLSSAHLRGVDSLTYVFSAGDSVRRYYVKGIIETPEPTSD